MTDFSDKAIEKVEEDTLERKAFAKHLATILANLQGKESTVFALCGAWGSGKTSIKNMAVDYLKKKEKEGIKGLPVVVEFNPWLISSFENLAKEFFRELSIVVNKTYKPDEIRKASKKVKQLNAYIEKLGLLEKSIAPVKKITNYILWGGIVVGIVSAPFAIDIAINIALGTTGISTLLNHSKSALEWVKSWIKTTADLEDEGIEDIKNQVCHELKNIPHPILIIIDDIDRLNPEEIKLIFQLVKVNANFPNVHYLLLFQRDRVQKCFSDYETGEESSANGRMYLEKIIQHLFDVPLISRDKLDSHVYSGIEKIIAEHEALQRTTASEEFGAYWREVAPLILRFIRNIRDVNRFLNGVNFHIPFFITSDIGTSTVSNFEANFVDVIALECLRTFVPDFYRRLPLQKQILTKQVTRSERASAIVRSDGTSNDTEQMLSSISQPDQREYTRNLMDILFPNQMWGAMPSGRYALDYQSARTQNRVCLTEKFDRYFELVLPEGITGADIEYIIESIKNEKVENLVKTFEGYHSTQRLLEILPELRYNIDKLGSEASPKLMRVLFDIGDTLGYDKESESLLRSSTNGLAESCIYAILREQKIKKEDIYKLLHQVIGESSSIFLPLYVVASEELRYDGVAGRSEPNFTQEEIRQLSVVCVAKIEQRAKAKPEYLLTIGQFRFLLYWWHEWAEEKQPIEEWVRFCLDKKERILIFTEAFVSVTTSWSSPQATYRRRIERTFLGELVSLERLIELFEQNKLQDEGDLYQLLLKAKRDKDNGKPDEWFNDDE